MRFFIAPHLAFLVQWLRVLGVDVQLWDKRKPFPVEGEAVVQWAPYPLPVEGTEARIMTLASSSREALLKEFFEVSGARPTFHRCSNVAFVVTTCLFPWTRRRPKKNGLSCLIMSIKPRSGLTGAIAADSFSGPARMCGT